MKKIPLSLRALIANMTLPDMVYLKAKNQWFDAEDVDLYKLQFYKDYVFLPFVKEAEIYDAFLDDEYLYKEKAELHQNENFEVAFRIFIDNNKKYGHELFRYYQRFRDAFLKPIAAEWCSKNKIPYIDDLD